jgi:hypothetical protein
MIISLHEVGGLFPLDETCNMGTGLIGVGGCLIVS